MWQLCNLNLGLVLTPADRRSHTPTSSQLQLQLCLVWPASPVCVKHVNNGVLGQGSCSLVLCMPNHFQMSLYPTAAPLTYLPGPRVPEFVVPTLTISVFSSFYYVSVSHFVSPGRAI